jgi:hypothetical protein
LDRTSITRNRVSVICKAIMAVFTPPPNHASTPPLDAFHELPSLFGFSVPGPVYAPASGGTRASVNTLRETKPFQSPSNPFFGIPDLGSDGDFESLNLAIPSGLLLPLIQPFSPEGDNDSTTGLYQDSTGDYPGNDHFPWGGGPTDSDVWVGNDHSFPGGKDLGPGGQGTDNFQGDHDNGAGGDNFGMKKDNWDYSGDYDNGAGRDHQGQNHDGPNSSRGDKSGDGDYGNLTHTDNVGNSDGGGDRQGDSDLGRGGDAGGDHWDNGDISGDSDHGQGSDYRITDHGDISLDSDVGRYQDHGGQFDNRDTTDGDYGTGNDFYNHDGFDSYLAGEPRDSDSGGCSSLDLAANLPPGGASAAIALQFAIWTLEGMDTILFMIPFGGQMGEAEALLRTVQTMLEQILEILGLPSWLSFTVEQVLNSLYGIPTTPLDFLNAGKKAAATLQPALDRLENENSIQGYKNLAAKNGCLSASCAAAYNALNDGVPLKICSDTGGDDHGVAHFHHVKRNSAH